MRIYTKIRSTISGGRVAGWIPDHVATALDDAEDFESYPGGEVSWDSQRKAVEDTYKIQASILDCDWLQGSISSIKIQCHSSIEALACCHKPDSMFKLRRYNNILEWLEGFNEESDPIDEMITTGEISWDGEDRMVFQVTHNGKVVGMAMGYGMAARMAWIALEGV